MKRIIVLTVVVLLYSSTASAQVPTVPNLGVNGVVGELVGTNGVVPSLLQSLTTQNFAPFINSTVGGSPASLAQGSAGVGGNLLLSGLLVTQNPAQVVKGLELIVRQLAAGLQLALAGDVLFPVPNFPALPGLASARNASTGGLPSLPGLGGLPMGPQALTGLIDTLLSVASGTGGSTPSLPGMDNLPLGPKALTGLINTLLSAAPAGLIPKT